MDHITNLSGELLELVISTILDPGDLFHLALACKRLHKLIVPDHLYFREIPTMWDDSYVWDHDRQFDTALWDALYQRPILARHTHTLQFVPLYHIGLGLAESRTRVLRNAEWTEEGSSPQGTLGTIPLSISKMDNLRIFLWNGWISEPTALSCIQGVFHGLDNCRNLASLTLHPGHIGWHFALSLPAQRLSFLTTLALGVPCMCKSCASMSFYEKLLFSRLDSLQDVQLELPLSYFDTESPMPCQWNHFFKTVNWPNIRRFTLDACGNDLSISNSILEAFIARHPLMDSFAHLGGRGYMGDSANLDFSFALENPSRLHSLKHVLSQRCRLPMIKELAQVSDLQFVDMSCFDDEELSSLGSLPTLRFCSLGINTDRHKSLTRLVQLFPGVEKLDVTSENRPLSELTITHYIANLEGLNRLTHLGGLLCFYHSEDENDHFVKIAAETLPSLTHVEICEYQHKVWALVERNAAGGYTRYKTVKITDDGPPGWGLFFFGIPWFGRR